ncbi:hypothetical protein CROQUDRAFT_102359 [Cronartium quercuum f. sp. fusiforme G11]|uniref:Uncharacterized protein n=1 Tax=Cronartium quercuum f. sp. fusiforme G11 TaxID=708437 RepID=A0A9P6N847_9BASI|nr:hypothetical protein CROQUDRAFT_102359 [Cronartium quercuum f. sp. fusiforme G11]
MWPIIQAEVSRGLQMNPVEVEILDKHDYQAIPKVDFSFRPIPGWMESQFEGESPIALMVYNVWIEWFKKFQSGKPIPNLEDFQRILTVICRRPQTSPIEKMFDFKEATQEGIGHFIDSSNPQLVSMRKQKAYGYLPYKKFLLSEGQRSREILKNCGIDISEFITQLSQKMSKKAIGAFSNNAETTACLATSQDGVMAASATDRMKILEKAMRVTENNLINGCLGLVTEIHKKYNDGLELDAVLMSSWKFLEKVLSLWEDLDWKQIFSVESSSSIKISVDQSVSKVLIPKTNPEKLFFDTKTFNPSFAVPMKVLWILLKGWLKHGLGSDDSRLKQWYEILPNITTLKGIYETTAKSYDERQSGHILSRRF